MINLFAVHMPPEVDGPLLETLHSGYVAQGPKVDEYEKDFGRAISNPLVLSLNSGTAALTLALRLAGVEHQSVVISTPMSCTATSLPILSLGASIIWADIDPSTGLMDPLSAREILKVWPRGLIKACMTVDWGGMPSDILGLRDVCEEYGITVIEDAAHALGASIYGVPVGAISPLTCFSTQAIKHLTTVDGGALACLDAKHYRRGKKLRWFGIDREAPAEDSRIDQDIEEWGWKFHMNDVMATIGIVQLKHLRRMVTLHRYNAQMYDEQLDSYFKKPPRIPGYESAYWLYTLRLPSSDARDRFRKFMLAHGVHVSQVHRRNDDYTVFKPYSRGPLPGVDEFSRGMICIPTHWALTDDERRHIIDTCNEFALRER